MHGDGSFVPPCIAVQLMHTRIAHCIPAISLGLLLVTALLASAAHAAPETIAGTFREYDVVLPVELRRMAGRGGLSPVTHALVTIATSVDRARDAPVLVVSATSDPGHQSSRRLLRAYADTALAAGWTIVAADPAEVVSPEQDDVPLRLALATAALATLAQDTPDASRAPLAFGGFSGGAKYSEWLAAAFASQGRSVIGIYLAGINEESLADAAHRFGVATAAFRRTPIFLQAGEKDEVSTPADHQAVASELRRAGFRNVRIEFFPGAHEISSGPLRTALEWFVVPATPLSLAK